MAMDFLAGITVRGFREDDYKCKKDSSLEPKITEALYKHIKGTNGVLWKEGIFDFSFPEDPTVITEEVPIRVEITFYDAGLFSQIFQKENLVYDVKVAVSGGFFGRRKVIVVLNQPAIAVCF
jgi:hypothetical protein